MVKRIIYSGTTGTHPVVVSDEHGLRSLCFGLSASRQSCISLSEPHILQLAYTRWMMCALPLHPMPSRFLLLGLGGGAIARFLLHHHPDAHIEAVETSELVIHLSRQYFALPRCDNLLVHHQDADRYLADPDRQSPVFDMAFVDIFGPDCMAPALFDPLFYGRILSRLSSNGIMAVNLWSGQHEQFQMARNAVDEASGRQMLQLQEHKRSNVILLAFAGEVPRKRLREVRKNSRSYQHSYGLDFGRYLKRLRRTNQPLLHSLFGRA